MTDHYEVLGVSRNATAEQIKKAYLKLARKLHPDVSSGEDNEERFKLVTHAYEVLSDVEKRKMYDMTGSETGNTGFGGANFGFNDIFDSFFGGSSQRSGPVSRASRGQDALIRVDLELSDAVFGVEKKVEIDTAQFCDVCDGNGCEPGTVLKKCDVCHGVGSVKKQVRSILGTMVASSPCGSCQGYGTVIPSPCLHCHGEGRVRARRTLTVKIPSGVDTGTRIQLSGEGEVGLFGGDSGDLYIDIKVKKHPIFLRDREDLHATFNVPMTGAILGTTLSFDSLDGREEIQIKAGTQSGEIVTLKNRGVARLRSMGRGDLKIHLQVVTPTKLTSEQEDLLKRFANLRDEKFSDGALTEHSQGLFAKLRDRLGN